jgi:hypothetical protein
MPKDSECHGLCLLTLKKCFAALKLNRAVWVSFYLGAYIIIIGNILLIVILFYKFELFLQFFKSDLIDCYYFLSIILISSYYPILYSYMLIWFLLILIILYFITLVLFYSFALVWI